MRQLKRAKVIYPGPPMTADSYPLELRVGERGVISLVELDSLQIEVCGQNGYAFTLWPSNVVWTEAFGPKDVVLAGASDSLIAVVRSDVTAPSVADPSESVPPPPTPAVIAAAAAEMRTETATALRVTAAGLASLAPTSKPATKPAPKPAPEQAADKQDDAGAKKPGPRNKYRRNNQ